MAFRISLYGMIAALTRTKGAQWARIIHEPLAFKPPRRWWRVEPELAFRCAMMTMLDSVSDCRVIISYIEAIEMNHDKAPLHRDVPLDAMPARRTHWYWRTQPKAFILIL